MPAWLARAGRVAPGLPALRGYRRADFPHDLAAGLSVAAIALPIGIAYADLAGFAPVVGLYASILPLAVYALFGTSRQLVIGPDAAACAMVAAALAPLAGGDPERYQSLSVVLALLSGVLCIAGSFLRLGALADFLSKPILVGLLNGVALSILMGQLGKLSGVAIEARGVVRPLLELASRLDQLHLPTLAVAAGSFALLLALPRALPRIPDALVVTILAAVVVKGLALDAHGVKTLDPVPAGLPRLQIPVFPPGQLPHLLADAAGLALVLFSSMMITARSFASKNRYDIDADRELAALGAVNIAAAFSQSFAVTGAGSRTAMSDASGGRTQLTGLVAAVSIAVVLLFFTQPLRYVPVATLAAVLVKAVVSLVNVADLREIYRIDRREFGLSVVVMVGVIVSGAIDAMLLAVGLALVRFVRVVARPPVEVLGETAELPGFHSVARHARAVTTPGLLVLRFNAPIVFFNAAYWKRATLGAVASAEPKLRWLVIDMIPVTQIDATGIYVAREVFETLHGQGVGVAIAGRKTEWMHWWSARGSTAPPYLRTFASVDEAVLALRRELGTPSG